MSETRWKKIEAGVFATNTPWHLDENDTCYHLMDYISGGGCLSSDANSLINNFKKDISTKGTNQWKYKERAIAQFAIEIARALPNDATLAPAPTSKRDDDPEYDDRLVRAVLAATKRDPTFTVELPITIHTNCPPAHAGGTRRPSELIRHMQWNDFDADPPNTLFLVDDMITSGGHFKACKNLIHRHHPEIEVIGIFWARAQRYDD